MRAPEIFEVVIAVLSAATVIGAIVGILWRVTRGTPETRHLKALQAELAAEEQQKKP
jgi:hypothetical protein